MALVIGGILALLGLAVAVYPFLRHRFFGETSGPDSEEDGAGPNADVALAEGELAEIYRAIGTLRLERQLGNIPEGLYREQLNGYRLRAAKALRDLELAPDDDEDWALEEEIRVARSGLFGIAGVGFSCSNCGRPILADLAECPECGAAISRPGAGSFPPSDIEEKDR